MTIQDMRERLSTLDIDHTTMPDSEVRLLHALTLDCEPGQEEAECEPAYDWREDSPF